MRKFLLEEMTPDEIEVAKANTDTVVVPIGTVEQHGPHLPVGTDVLIPKSIALRLAERLPVVVAPAIYYGNSLSMSGMKGVFSISPESLASLVLDLCRAFAAQGFKKVVFLNGHAGNTHVLNFIGHKARIETRLKVIRVEWWAIASEEISAICETPPDHADEAETSMMLVSSSELVDMRKAPKEEFSKEVTRRLLGNKKRNAIGIYVPFASWTKTGIIGDATKATEEKGEKIMDAVLENIVKVLTHIDDVF